MPRAVSRGGGGPHLASLALSSASSDSIFSTKNPITMDVENLEVTEEEHFWNVSSSSSADRAEPQRKRRGGGLRLLRLRSPRTTYNDPSDVQSTGDLSRAIDGLNRQAAAAGVPAEARDAWTTVSGLRSVGTFQTFSSHDTVKASNKQQLAAAAASEQPSVPLLKSQANGASKSSSSSHKGRWKNIKKAIHVVKSASSRLTPTSSPPPTPLAAATRSRSGGSETAASSCAAAAAEAAWTTSANDMSPEDELKRGRLDGMDVLSLGAALERILPLPPNAPPRNNNNNADQEEPWNHWMDSCTGTTDKYNPTAALGQTLRRAGPPDIILEGFCEAERWSLRIEQGFDADDDSHKHTPNKVMPYPPPPPPPPPMNEVTPSSSSSSSDGGSPDLPTHKLWSTLWGSEPPPASTLPTLEEIGGTGGGNDDADGDPLLDLAAESSVPIDVDEDTFIVTTREHLDAIHAICSVPIRAGKLDKAIAILQKLLHGLDAAVVTNADIKQLLRGATCHNIGLLQLWQGEYGAAVESLARAANCRQGCPYVSQRDVAVTFVRQGQALFALRRYHQALACFDKALDVTPVDQVIRAKILVNAGVAYYLTGDLAQALQSFTDALTIQRKWLDGPVRRESLVYEASVTLSNMGKLYLERGDDGMASFVYEEALLLLKTVFDKTHPIIQTSLINLAVSKARQSSSIPKAIKILERVRRLQVELYGTSDACVIRTCGIMAHLCAAQNRRAQAETLYQAVYAWQKVWLSADHPARKNIRRCLAQLPKENSWI